MASNVSGRVSVMGVGDRIMVLFNITGPTSYTQVTPGTPPTGGLIISAQAFGLKDVEVVLAGMDETGTYEVVATKLAPASGSEFPNSALFMWRVATTGAQVAATTNLSTYTVHCVAFGR